MKVLIMNKEYISYSEVRQWKECGWRHKLQYIDKIVTFEESPHLHYGTIVHDACEHYLKTKELKLEEVVNNIKRSWSEHGFDSQDFVQLQTQKALLQEWKYRHNHLNDWLKWAETSISRVPSFLDEEFPGWETVAAEEELMEEIPGQYPKFKGFIDCIIKIPQSNGTYKYWIIDWKTSSARGWDREKQSNFLTQAQLILYKHFWGTKNNIPMNKIMCGFVLLKKVKKQEKACQLIRVASGPKSLEKANKMVSSMIKTVGKRMHLKNKTSCKFCDYANTQHCL